MHMHGESAVSMLVLVLVAGLLFATLASSCLIPSKNAGKEKQDVETLSATIEGHVLNATSYAPIANATIVIKPGNFTTVSDINGSFSFVVPGDENYTINASCEGYFPNEETVFCAQNKTVHVDLLLFAVGTSFENGTIYGYVFDGMINRPIPHALVSIVPEDLSVVTNELGYYTLSVRGSTYYTLTANASGYYNASSFVFLEPNGTQNVSFYMTPLSSTISYIYGYVYDAINTTRIVGADIYIEPGNINTTTDLNGYYNITVTGNMDYTMTVRADEYQATTKTIHVNATESLRVDVPLMPVVSQNAKIEGYVYDLVHNTVIPGAQISAIPGNLTAVTNQSGYYIIEVFPGVNYTIKCIAEGYLENYTYVVLKPDETKRIDFYLSTVYNYGRVFGTVYDITTHSPLPSALVLIEPDGISAYTNTSGMYEFLLRMDVNYRLSASCENYTPSALTFVLNQSEMELNIFLYPKIYNQTVNITGTVRDYAGNPVSNAEVVLRSTNNQLLLVNFTDASGKFLFRDLPVLLNYTISISKEGYDQITLTVYSSNFTDDPYIIPQNLTKLKAIQNESFEYIPLVYTAILIVVIVVAFITAYFVMRRNL